MEIIQLEPYPYYIAVVFSKEQHDRLCEQLNLDPFGHWNEPSEDQPVASCSFYRRKTSPRALGVMSFYDADFDLVSAAHEGVHVLSDMYIQIGAKYDPLNDEHYAYSLEFIMYHVRRLYEEHCSEAVAEAMKPMIATGNHPAIAPQPTLHDLNKGPNQSGFLDE